MLVVLTNCLCRVRWSLSVAGGGARKCRTTVRSIALWLVGLGMGCNGLSGDSCRIRWVQIVQGLWTSAWTFAIDRCLSVGVGGIGVGCGVCGALVVGPVTVVVSVS